MDVIFLALMVEISQQVSLLSLDFFWLTPPLAWNHYIWVLVPFLATPNHPSSHSSNQPAIFPS